MGRSEGARSTLEGFDLRQRLGSGAMGTVYEAYDRRRDILVALKMLRTGEPDAVYRFKQEFRALADIAHPNLVGLYELFATEQQWYFTMERLRGVDALTWVHGASDEPRTAQGAFTTATQQISSDATVDRGRLRELVLQLARGLMALHEGGHLHRDVKPSNVIVTDEGRVVLLDFGVVAELGGKRWGHEDNLLVGTPAYMSPEQAAASEVGPASDWYALGALLYHALVGRPPFVGLPEEIVESKQTQEPKPVHALRPEAPSDLAELCMALLARDPGRRPTGEDVLAASSERPRRSSSAALDPAPPELPALIGRKTEMAALQAAFDRSLEGYGLAVCVHGRAGYGKSSVVRELAARVEADPEAVVLSGRCYERESVPYKAVDSLVDGLARYLSTRAPHEVEALLPRDVLVLARVFPVLQRVDAIAGARRRSEVAEDPHERRRRAAAALRDLFARLAAERPVLVFIDDLHWGDLDSVAFLDGLVRPPAPPALLFVCAYRSEDADGSELLDALLRRWRQAQVDIRTIEVGPLDPGASLRLAKALLDGAEELGHAAAALARDAGGHPYLLHEMVRYLRTPAAREADDPSELTLERVIARRVAALPEGPRRLMEVMAVAGRPIESTTAAEAAGLAPEDAARFIHELVVAQLVLRSSGPTGERIGPYHDRIRETIAAELSADERREHHRCLAGAIARRSRPDAEALATHWHEAGELREAARYAALAAEQAADALAFDRAAALYQTALAWGGADEARTRALRVAMADAMANAGRGAAAARVYAEAAAGASGAEAMELSRRAAEQWLRTGHLERGLEAIASVLQALDMRLAPTPLRALVSFLYRRLRLRLRGSGYRLRDPGDISDQALFRIDVLRSVAVGIGLIDPVRGADFQTRNLILSLEAGEPSRIAISLALEAAYSASSGSKTWHRTTRFSREALELAGRIEEPFPIAFAHLVAGTAAFLHGDWRDARDGCERAEAMLRERCTGVEWELASARTFLLGARYYLGELTDLAERVPRYLDAAEERGDLYAATSLRTGRANAAWLVVDDAARARAQVEQAASQWTQEGFHVQHFYLWMARTNIALYEGDAEAAWAQIERVWKPMSKSLLLRVQTLRIEASGLRARAALARHAQTGDRDLLAIARKDARRLGKEPVTWARALAASIEASLAAVRDDAGAPMWRAAAVADEAQMAPLAAACRMAGGDDEGLSALEAMGARDPARFAAMVLPAVAPPAR